MSLNLLLTSLVVAVTTATAIAVLLAFRRRAPPGGFLHDSERAGAIFTFVGTVFSVLLAFIIFLALETYTSAKGEAAHEADALLEQFEIAAILPAEDRDRIRGQLICYGRSVIEDGWEQMREGRRSQHVDAWVLEIERSIDQVTVADPKTEIAFGKFFDETIERENAGAAAWSRLKGWCPRRCG